MVFDILLYISLSICFLGLLYRISTWFTRKIGMAAYTVTTAERVSEAIRATATVLFSLKILTLVKVFILDVLLQFRILKEDFLRWLMHMFIFWGFMLLLLMHAMQSIISESLFTDYYSTINPFMFLRDFFGFLVLAGLAIAVCRRLILKIPRLKTNASDKYAVAILASIMISGIFLEGLKITSYSEFMRMEEDYAVLDDPKDIQALESYWVQNYGLVSGNVQQPFDAEILAHGEELHGESCAECHSRPQWAFTGYAAGRLLKPVALALDRAGGVTFFWYVHILACFLGLAYLPFSKMFHIVSTPVSLMVNAVSDGKTSHPANLATRQAMELDACMHCGTCSVGCSVGVAFSQTGNCYILPSEKIQFLKNYAANKDLDENGLRAIQEGIYLCTNCDRCTVRCPAGIRLKDLWLNVREDLIRKGLPVPMVLSQFSFYRGLNRGNLDPNTYSEPLTQAKELFAKTYELIGKPQEVISLSPVNEEFKQKADISSQANTYAYCFSCENCSTVCPVVGNYENPEDALDLLPHQIMRSLGLGLKDLAMGSNMLWDCVTCYQCQEHCPQGVKVTDVLYELKNMAMEEVMGSKTLQEPKRANR